MNLNLGDEFSFQYQIFISEIVFFIFLVFSSQKKISHLIDESSHSEITNLRLIYFRAQPFLIITLTLLYRYGADLEFEYYSDPKRF